MGVQKRVYLAQRMSYMIYLNINLKYIGLNCVKQKILEVFD